MPVRPLFEIGIISINLSKIKSPDVPPEVITLKNYCMIYAPTIDFKGYVKSSEAKTMISPAQMHKHHSTHC